jgi:regulator of protease activity HflC (stomatin/prohibitin superfamily)
MLWKYTVREGHRGLLFADGRLVDCLMPGKHWRFTVFTKFDVELLDVEDGIVELSSAMDVERVLPAGEGIVVDVPADHAGLVTLDERPFRALAPGRYLLWQLEGVMKAVLVNLEALETEIPQRFWDYAPGRFLNVVIVRPFERALVYADGALAKVLEAGRHGLSPWNRKLQVETIDVREQEQQVIGQELVTQDKVSLRLNLIAKYRIVDAVASVESVKQLPNAIYAEMQVTARGAVAGVGVDALLERRAELSQLMTAALSERAKTWGVEVIRLDIKDVVLPGDMKVLLNQVIEAEKRAAAQVILRREEVAATRSLANTAKLLSQNPVLLRLKELEAIKDIAERIPNLTVFVGGEEMTRSLRLGAKALTEGE